jgi:hypothetical protein
VPPMELLGESCPHEGEYCVSYEPKESCCLLMQCQCMHRDLNSENELLWHCAHVGCEDCGPYFRCDRYPCGHDCPWSCDEGCVSESFWPFSYPEVVCAADEDTGSGAGIDTVEKSSDSVSLD